MTVLYEYFCLVKLHASLISKILICLLIWGANLHDSIQTYCFEMEHISDIINEQ